MIRYEFFDDGKLLIIKYIGNISKKSLISFFKFLVEEKDVSSLKVVLADYRDAKDTYAISNVFEIVEARKNFTTGLGEIQTIFLVSNPKNTAISLMYSDYLKGYSNVNIFSTIAATRNYLSMNVTNHELERMLDNPKFEYSK